MPHVLSLRDVTVSTTLGHSAHVPARTPTPIPLAIVPAALQLGCVLCGPKGEALDIADEQRILQPPAPPKKPVKNELDLDEDPETDPAPPEDIVAQALEVIRLQKAAPSTPPAPPAPPAPSGEPPADPVVRRAAIVEAIKKLIVERDASNFKQDGTPKQKAANKAAGFNVDSLELIEAMAEVNVTG